MLKNVQLKIILIFSALGIVLIGGMGIIYAYNLLNMDSQMIVQTEEQIKEYSYLISNEIRNIKLITIILVSVYGLISLLIGIFVSKVILDPIARLIDSAPRIAAGEEIELNENKRKTESDETR